MCYVFVLCHGVKYFCNESCVILHDFLKCFFVVVKLLSQENTKIGLTITLAFDRVDTV